MVSGRGSVGAVGAVSSGMGTELAVDGRPVRYFPAAELVAADNGSIFDRLRDRQLAGPPRDRRFLLSWLASAMPVFAATRARRIRAHTFVTACPT